MTRGCSEKSKSIKRATIEDGFAEILQGLQPTRQLFDLVKAMMVDAWEARLKSVTDGQVETKRQLKATNNQMESLLDRIVDADSPAVISAYEARLGKLEREKISSH